MFTVEHVLAPFRTVIVPHSVFLRSATVRTAKHHLADAVLRCTD